MNFNMVPLGFQMKVMLQQEKQMEPICKMIWDQTLHLLLRLVENEMSVTGV